MKRVSDLLAALAVCGLLTSVTLHVLVALGAISLWRQFLASDIAYWSVICACLAVVSERRRV